MSAKFETVTKTTARTAAGFGAALAGLGVAAPAQAGVVNLTVTPSTFTQTVMFGTIRTSGGSQVSFTTTSGMGQILFVGFNNFFSTTSGTIVSARIAGARNVLAGTGPAVPAGTVTAVTQSSPKVATSEFTGTAHFDFQIEGSGNLGWFSIQYNGFGGDAVFLGGAINDMGQPIVRGESAAAVPLPATLPLAGLGVLALGAAGLRRKRKAAAAA